MVKIPKKYQLSLQFMVKLSIVIGAFYFIYQKIVVNDKLPYTVLIQSIKRHILTNYFNLFLLILFSFLNWFFDIIKWKSLVATIQKISLKQAASQSLAAHTAALLTPNRIGEYGVKAMYFKKNLRKKVILLNLTHHFLQMTVTTIFGIIGLCYVLENNDINIPIFSIRKTSYFISIIFAFLLLGKIIIHKKIRNFYWLKIVNFIKNMPLKIIGLSFLFSVIKYLIFVHQFIYLLHLFDVETTYSKTLFLLFAFYFIASIIPSLPIFDWLVKGSIAIMILELISIDDAVIIVITTIMWLLNFALPAIIGGYSILKYEKQDYIYKKIKND